MLTIPFLHTERIFIIFDPHTANAIPTNEIIMYYGKNAPSRGLSTSFRSQKTTEKMRNQFITFSLSQRTDVALSTRLHMTHWRSKAAEIEKVLSLALMMMWECNKRINNENGYLILFFFPCGGWISAWQPDGRILDTIHLWADFFTQLNWYVWSTAFISARLLLGSHF